MRRLADPLGIHAVPQRQLAVFRLVFVIFFMWYGLPEYGYLGHFPDLLFSPPYYSLANLLSGWPPSTFFTALTVVNVLAFAGIALGLFTRMSSVLFSVTALIGHNFKYSFGKIDHGEFMLLVAPIFLAYAGWGSYLSMDRLMAERSTRRNAVNWMREADRDNGYPMGMLAISFALAMVSSGLMKLQGGWFDWGLEAIKGNLMRNYIATGREHHWTEMLLGIRSHLFWKAADISVVLFEVGFLFALFHRRAWMAFLFATVIFHYTIWQTFRIAFYHNPVFYLVFLHWPAFTGYEWRLKLRRWSYPVFLLWTIVVILFTINVLRYFRLGSVQGTHYDLSMLAWRFGVHLPQYDLVFLICGGLILIRLFLPRTRKAAPTTRGDANGMDLPPDMVQ